MTNEEILALAEKTYSLGCKPATRLYYSPRFGDHACVIGAALLALGRKGDLSFDSDESNRRLAEEVFERNRSWIRGVEDGFDNRIQTTFFDELLQPDLVHPDLDSYTQGKEFGEKAYRKFIRFILGEKPNEADQTQA